MEYACAFPYISSSKSIHTNIDVSIQYIIHHTITYII